MIPPVVHAVLTGDLVDSSSRVAGGSAAKVLRQLRAAFSATKQKIKHLEEFQIFRGDSFQTVVQDPGDAVRAALLLRCRCLLDVELDVRIAIGVGSVDHHSARSVGEGTGPAFTNSGRALDKLTDPRRLILVSHDEGVNAEMTAFTALLDALVRSWSKRAVAVVAEALAEVPQTKIARLLRVSQSAVSQRLGVAQWWAVAEALDRWSQIASRFEKPNKA